MVVWGRKRYGVGGYTIVGSVSNFNGYSLATTIPVVASVNVEMGPVIANIFAGRANCSSFTDTSLASLVPRFAIR